LDNTRSGTYPTDIPACPGAMVTDLSHWPVVIMRPPAQLMRDDDFQAYLEWMERYVTTRRIPYAVVNDARLAPPPSANQRKMVAAQMQRLDAYTREYCKGATFVFESALMRGIMTAIFWITKPGYPTEVFGDVGSAVEWCQAQLNQPRQRSLRAR